MPRSRRRFLPRGRSFSVGLFFALLFAVQVQAQGLADVRTDLASAIRVIRPLMREDPQRAIKMLQNLRGEYPNNEHVLLMLGETYQHIGKLDSAVVAYETLVQHHPNNIRGSAYLGSAYYKLNRESDGDAVFRAVIERTEHGINTYRTIGSTLARNGYYDAALRIYEEGRLENRGNYILTIDIAYMHKLMGNNEACLTEYLRLVETDPKQNRLVRSKVLELLRDPNADREALIAMVRTEAELPKPNRQELFALLATIYLENGALESAFDMALQAEQGDESTGTVLYNLADQAIAEYHRRGPADRAPYFSLSMRALEAFLDGYPDASQAPRGNLLMVDLLVELAMGRVKPEPGMQMDRVVERSMRSLDWLIETYPGTEYAEQAYLRKGDVLFKLLKRTDEALEIYNEGLKHAKHQPAEFAERLGRVYLITDQYDSAERHLKRLVRTARPDLRETGIYYSGLLLSFTGEFEAARDTLTGLAESNPSSSFTNDAIQLAWAIEEGLKGDQAVLKIYIASLKAEFGDDTGGAIEQLGAIVALPADTPLRKRSLFGRGELYVEAAQYDAAIASYELYIADYPKDVQVPECHRRIAQVYEVGLGDMDLAIDRYEDILMMYPHYIFLNEVRDDVLRIRSEMENQP